jgi:hypothetical protein
MRLAFALFAAVALLSCTSASEDAGEQRNPFSPGEPVADGFVVPEGSELLLPPAPIENRTFDGSSAERRWTAWLLPERPVALVADVVGQAEAMGFSLTGQQRGTACLIGSNDQYPTVDLSSPTPSEPLTAIVCHVRGSREVDDRVETLYLRTEQAAPGQFGIMNTATLTFERWPVGVNPTFPGEPLVPIPTDRLDLSLDVDLDPPPLEPGASISTSGTEATLIEGSEVVAPINDEICQGGFSTVLEVTGDPDEVYQGYVTQLRDWLTWVEPADREVDEEESMLLGRTIQHARVYGDDSSIYHVVMVAGEDEPVRLLYELCGG